MTARQSFHKLGAHAVVIGASMAGLLTARALSTHFERVTLLERDDVRDAPESRKGQPQTRHLHFLLAGGLEVLTRYFPDLAEALEAGGATIGDMAENMRWYCYGGYRQPHHSGLDLVLATRPFLEWHVRRRVAVRPNIRLLGGCKVEGLMTTGDASRISGVRYTCGGDDRQETLSADLVVDACGRGSPSPRWLAELGYGRPEATAVTVKVGYATRFYRRDSLASGSRDWRFITPEIPRERRGGGAFPVEADRWLVTVAGWHGDHPPSDEEGFLAFVRELPAPDVYDLVSGCEPLSDIAIHRFPSSLRRLYEKLRRFPEGYLVIGDALASFNPVYGQGMTSAALQAWELDRTLSERSELQGVAKSFFKRAAKVVDTPWRLATGEDFRFPETTGRKAPGTDLLNAYVSRVHLATLHDPVVCTNFLKMLNLLQPPASLFHPRMVRRVLRRRRAKTNPPGASGAKEQADARKRA